MATKAAPAEVVDDAAVYDGGGGKEAQDRLIAAEAMSALCSGALGLPAVIPDHIEDAQITYEHGGIPPQNGGTGTGTDRSGDEGSSINEQDIREDSDSRAFELEKSQKKLSLLNVVEARHNQEIAAVQSSSGFANGLQQFINFVERNESQITAIPVREEIVKIDGDCKTSHISPAWNEFEASVVLENMKHSATDKPSKRTKEERREAKRRKKAKREARISEALRNGTLLDGDLGLNDKKSKKRTRFDSGTSDSLSNVPIANVPVPQVTALPIPGPGHMLSSRLSDERPNEIPQKHPSEYLTNPVQTVYSPDLYRLPAPTPTISAPLYKHYPPYVNPEKEPSALLQALKSRPQHTLLLPNTVPQSVVSQNLAKHILQPPISVNSVVYPIPTVDVQRRQSNEIQDSPLNLSLNNRIEYMAANSYNKDPNHRNDGFAYKMAAAGNYQTQPEMIYPGVKTTQIAHVNPYVIPLSEEEQRLNEKAGRKLKKKRKKEKLARRLERGDSVASNYNDNNGDLALRHKHRHKKKKRLRDSISETVESVAKGNSYGGVNVFNVMPKFMLCSNSGVINVPQAVVHPTIVSSAPSVLSPQFYMLPSNSHDVKHPPLPAPHLTLPAPHPTLQSPYPRGYNHVPSTDARTPNITNYASTSSAPSYPLITQPLITNELRSPLYNTTLTTPTYNQIASIYPNVISSTSELTNNASHKHESPLNATQRPTNLKFPPSLVSMGNWANSSAITRLSESVMNLVSSKEYSKDGRRSQTTPPRAVPSVPSVQSDTREFTDTKPHIKVESAHSPANSDPDKSSLSTLLPFKKRKLEQYRAEVGSHPDPEAPSLMINPAISLQCLDENNLLVRPDDDGDIPLHIAVARENVDAVNDYLRLMTHAGCNIDVLNWDRQTPLHIAVMTNQPACVQCLLESGANIEIPTSRGSTSLHLGVTYGGIELVEVLLSSDRAKHCLGLRDFDGFSVLHTAVNTRKLEVVQLLLQHVSDINIKDGKSGRSPLFHAVENGDEPMVTLLLRHCANANITNYSGSTPLVAASGRGFYEIAISLVSHGAETKGYDFADVCRTGNTPFTQKISQMMQQNAGAGIASLKRKLESVKNTFNRKPYSSDDPIGGKDISDESIGGKAGHRDNSPHDDVSDEMIGRNVGHRDNSPSDDVSDDVIGVGKTGYRGSSSADSVSDEMISEKVSRRSNSPIDLVTDDVIRGKGHRSNSSIDLVNDENIAGKDHRRSNTPIDLVTDNPIGQKDGRHSNSPIDLVMDGRNSTNQVKSSNEKASNIAIGVKVEDRERRPIVSVSSNSIGPKIVLGNLIGTRHSEIAPKTETTTETVQGEILDLSNGFTVRNMKDGDVVMDNRENSDKNQTDKINAEKCVKISEIVDADERSLEENFAGVDEEKLVLDESNGRLKVMDDNCRILSIEHDDTVEKTGIEKDGEKIVEMVNEVRKDENSEKICENKNLTLQKYEGQNNEDMDKKIENVDLTVNSEVSENGLDEDEKTKTSKTENRKRSYDNITSENEDAKVLKNQTVEKISNDDGQVVAKKERPSSFEFLTDVCIKVKGSMESQNGIKVENETESKNVKLRDSLGFETTDEKTDVVEIAVEDKNEISSLSTDNVDGDVKMSNSEMKMTDSEMKTTNSEVKVTDSEVIMTQSEVKTTESEVKMTPEVKTDIKNSNNLDINETDEENRPEKENLIAKSPIKQNQQSSAPVNVDETPTIKPSVKLDKRPVFEDHNRDEIETIKARCRRNRNRRVVDRLSISCKRVYVENFRGVERRTKQVDGLYSACRRAALMERLEMFASAVCDSDEKNLELLERETGVGDDLPDNVTKSLSPILSDSLQNTIADHESVVKTKLNDDEILTESQTNHKISVDESNIDTHSVDGEQKIDTETLKDAQILKDEPKIIDMQIVKSPSKIEVENIVESKMNSQSFEVEPKIIDTQTVNDQSEIDAQSFESRPKIEVESLIGTKTIEVKSEIDTECLKVESKIGSENESINVNKIQKIESNIVEPNLTVNDDQIVKIETHIGTQNLKVESEIDTLSLQSDSEIDTQTLRIKSEIDAYTLEVEATMGPQIVKVESQTDLQSINDEEESKLEVDILEVEKSQNDAQSFKFVLSEIDAHLLKLDETKNELKPIELDDEKHDLIFRVDTDNDVCLNTVLESSDTLNISQNVNSNSANGGYLTDRRTFVKNPSNIYTEYATDCTNMNSNCNLKNDKLLADIEAAEERYVKICALRNVIRLYLKIVEKSTVNQQLSEITTENHTEVSPRDDENSSSVEIVNVNSVGDNCLENDRKIGVENEFNFDFSSLKKANNDLREKVGKLSIYIDSFCIKNKIKNCTVTDSEKLDENLLNNLTNRTMSGFSCVNTNSQSTLSLHNPNQSVHSLQTLSQKVVTDLLNKTTEIVQNELTFENDVKISNPDRSCSNFDSLAVIEKDVHSKMHEIVSKCELENGICDDSGIDVSSESVYSNNDDIT